MKCCIGGMLCTLLHEQARCPMPGTDEMYYIAINYHLHALSRLDVLGLLLSGDVT